MTANATTAAPNLSTATPHHRRTREEVENLAKNFVATPVEDVPPQAKPRQRLMLAAGGSVALLVLVVLVALVLSPGRQESARPEQADAARAAAEAEQWRQRYEAERERKRQELKAGSDYMAKMAAADSTLVKEMAGRAAQLTAEPEAPAEPAPVRAQKPRSAEPTPRETEPTPRTTTQTAVAAPAPAPAPAPAAVQPAASEPTAPAAAPAEKKTAPAAEPATVASAPSCKQHVSQLSASGTLTYADIARMKGARTDGRGHVFTPPVMLDDGRRVIFEVMPDGCMKWRRA